MSGPLFPVNKMRKKKIRKTRENDSVTDLIATGLRPQDMGTEIGNVDKVLRSKCANEASVCRLLPFLSSELRNGN